MFKRLIAVAALAAALVVPAGADVRFSGVPGRVIYKYTGTRMTSFIVYFELNGPHGANPVKLTFKVPDNTKDVKDYKDLAHALAQADLAWNYSAFFELRYTTTAKECWLGLNPDGSISSCGLSQTVTSGNTFNVSRSYLESGQFGPPGTGF